MNLRVGYVLALQNLKLALTLLVALAGCTKTGAGAVGTTSRSSTIQAGDANAMIDAGHGTVDGSVDGAGTALCCSVPRVLTGLEKYDPNYAMPYHNVMVNGTPQQQAYAICDQLSSWTEPLRPRASPSQADVDRYMAQFKAGPNVAIVLPCWNPVQGNSSYGQWQCGGDAGQAASCMNNGLSCGVGSVCWFDPGNTNGYGCTGTVTKCN